MSVTLKEVDYENCPFCQTNLKDTYGGEAWREYMNDIYERYDYNKGGYYYYKKENMFIICAKCKRKIKFGDLKPIKLNVNY